MQNQMNAIVVSEFGAENVLRYTQAPIPQPAAGQVRVKMHAVGVNPVETYIRAGSYAIKPALPYTPGNDGAGVVDAVGEGVTGLQEGQRVFVAATLAQHNTGTYAEYTVCDADAVHGLPGNTSFEQGAGLGTPGLAAAHALFFRAGVKPGEVVLVHGGSGGVGTLAVQLARRAGAVVLGTAGNDTGLALVKKLGAHAVFNHRQEGYTDKIIAASGGNGPDIVVEMVANVNLAKDMQMLAKYGRVVIVGNHGTTEFDPRSAMGKDAAVLGMNVINMGQQQYRQAMYILSAAMETGLETIIASTLPLRQAAKAHRDVAGKNKNGKIILTVHNA